MSRATIPVGTSGIEMAEPIENCSKPGIVSRSRQRNQVSDLDSGAAARPPRA